MTFGRLYRRGLSCKTRSRVCPRVHAPRVLNDGHVVGESADVVVGAKGLFQSERDSVGQSFCRTASRLRPTHRGHRVRPLAHNHTRVERGTRKANVYELVHTQSGERARVGHKGFCVLVVDPSVGMADVLRRKVRICIS